jgi:hypothetical protein
MINKLSESINLIEIIVGSVGLLLTIIVTGYQFRSTCFPMTRVSMVNRSILLGVMFLIGAFSILLLSNGIYPDNFLQNKIIIMFMCVSLPFALLSGFTSYKRLNWLNMHYKKIRIVSFWHWEAINDQSDENS